MRRGGGVRLVPVARLYEEWITLSSVQINPYPSDKTDAFLNLIGQQANFIH